MKEFFFTLLFISGSLCLNAQEVKNDSKDIVTNSKTTSLPSDTAQKSSVKNNEIKLNELILQRGSNNIQPAENIVATPAENNKPKPGNTETRNRNN